MHAFGSGGLFTGETDEIINEGEHSDPEGDRNRPTPGAADGKGGVEQASEGAVFEEDVGEVGDEPGAKVNFKDEIEEQFGQEVDQDEPQRDADIRVINGSEGVVEDERKRDGEGQESNANSMDEVHFCMARSNKDARNEQVEGNGGQAEDEIKRCGHVCSL